MSALDSRCGAGRAMTSQRSLGTDVYAEVHPKRSNSDGHLPTWYNPESVGRLEVEAGVAKWIEAEEEASRPPRADFCLLSPVGRKRLLWDISWCVAMIYEIWITPFDLVFMQEDALPDYFWVTSLVTLCFFAADIVLNFFTGYVDDGRQCLVMQWRLVVANYACSWFLFDVLVTVPWDMIQGGSGSYTALRAAKAAKVSKATKVLKLFRLMRMLKMVRHAKTFDYFMDQRAREEVGRRRSLREREWRRVGSLMRPALRPLLRLGKPAQLVALLALHAHLYGCLWAAAQSGWATSESVDEALPKYFESFWCAYAMLVFGGVPENRTPGVWAVQMVLYTERLFLVAAGASTLIFRLLILREQDAQFTVRSKGALEYLREHQVSAELQLQILSNFQATGKTLKMKSHFCSLMEADLPAELRRHICEEMWVPKLLSLGLLCRVASWDDRVIMELAQVVREELYASKVMVFKQGDAANAAYLVLKGEVAVGGPNKPVPPFTDGMWLSEKSLLGLGLRRAGMARTRTHTTLLVVPTAGLIDRLEEYDLRAKFDAFCAKELWRGLCGRCGLLGDHFSDECPIVERAPSPSKWSPKHLWRKLTRAAPSTPGSPTGMARDLKIYLQEKQLERLGPLLLHLECKNLDQLARLDLASLRHALEVHGEDALTDEEAWSLRAVEVQAFLTNTISLVLRGVKTEARGEYLFFLSHYKLEAGTEAALMRTELEQLLREDNQELRSSDSLVFLDSEDLLTLEHLQEQVRGSQYLALLLTTNVLTRPWVLVEIVTALRAGVQVVPVELQKNGNDFEFPDEAFYQSLLDSSLLGDDGTSMLRSHQIEPLDVVEALKQVFQRIAVPYSPHRPESIRRAELKALLRQCVVATPAAATMASSGGGGRASRWGPSRVSGFGFRSRRTIA